MEIIQANRSNVHICSQLYKVLEEASPGGRSANFTVFLECFGSLFSAPNLVGHGLFG